MRSYEFEAVVYDGEVYCLDCLPEGTSEDNESAEPIFAGSEWDYYPACSVCGEKHTYVSLTNDGAIYEAEQSGIEIFREEFANIEPGTWQADLMAEYPSDEQETAKRELAGWWWWSCEPGCMPDGPFNTNVDAAWNAIS